MTLRDTLLLSVRSFRRRPMRTILTVLGMGVGIGAVLFLVSLGYGLQRVILSQITTADSLLSLDVAPGGNGVIEITDSTIRDFESIPEVAEVSPLRQHTGQITLADVTGDAILFEAPPNFFRLQGTAVDHGLNFSSSTGDELIVSSVSAQLFNLDNSDNLLGQKVSLSLFRISEASEEGVEEIELVEIPKEFTITGVIEDDSLNFIYVPNGRLGLENTGSYSLAKVKVHDSDNLESVRNIIIDKGYIVSALSDTIEEANKIFGVIQVVLGLFGLIALVVSAIGMFNTMTITLLERINEIGIMRAIGATKKDIQGLFLFESLLIGFLGGVSGIIIGFLGGQVVNLIINIFARNLGGQALDLFYSPLWFILFILVFSALIGIITGLYPAHRAGSLNPLDALRYK